MPANADLNSYGNHWKYKRAYAQTDDADVAVKVPVEFLSDSSERSGLGCYWGYHGLVPMIGYFSGSSYGSDSQCNRGYRTV
jgi:hypothetical protein